ncbi:hypothetical protein EIP91_005656 [Steccherinum ochraceum]|uniref:Uncharacterized protein n=1 Tax=Steccherinum ochraceum TaxID=92696 RepID=A0A4V2MVS1_9APHY|nr:hypothetical protein EIP91_005656 [Steccherinum ochraceum]
MIIPINLLNRNSSSHGPLPPQLVQLQFGSDELVLIEMQGTLEADEDKAGQMVGKLTIDDKTKKSTLLIGHHLLEGKLVNLPKPYAVLHRPPRSPSENADEDGMTESCRRLRSSSLLSSTATTTLNAIPASPRDPSLSEAKPSIRLHYKLTAMSRQSKPLTLARIEDLTLGAFAFVPSSETINHLIRYLSTWSGTDKLFMIIQYSLKLVVPFLHFRARMQHKAGMRKAPTSDAAVGLSKLGSLLSDARMLSNIWGMLPIIQWLTSLERNPPPTRRLHTIERLQGWSMLCYYPLEHVYYLLSHSIIPSQISRPSLSSFLSSSTLEPKDNTINLDAGAISRLSVRFWTLYVLLQFAHLREDGKLLKQRERALGKSKATTAQAEKEELRKRWDALWGQVVVNLGYAPLTLHWSLEGGLFKNDVWVGVFGLIAALASWRNGWKATALPPPAPVEPEQDLAEILSEKAPTSTSGFESVTDADILSSANLTGSVASA